MSEQTRIKYVGITSIQVSFDGNNDKEFVYSCIRPFQNRHSLNGKRIIFLRSFNKSKDR